MYLYFARAAGTALLTSALLLKQPLPFMLTLSTQAQVGLLQNAQ